MSRALSARAIDHVECWFGTKEQEMMFAVSRLGFNAALEADLGHGRLALKVRANFRRPVKADYEWSWKCQVVVQCFGEI